VQITTLQIDADFAINTENVITANLQPIFSNPSAYRFVKAKNSDLPT
jgi:hypothetical protein